MQLGSLELQIFVALVLVLGSAFVALVCDFLKGNNEQLRERNIELRVRQDERERMGLFEPLAHPIAWLQGLAALARNPGLAEAVAGGGASTTAPPQAAAPQAAAPPSAAPSEAPPEVQADLENLTGAASPSAGDSAADRNPQRRHRYDEFKAAAKHQTWATKEELEQLAGRAARIRARHEASHRKPDDLIGAAKVPAEPPPAPVVAEVKEAPRRPKVAELPKLEQAPAVLPAATPVEPPKPVEIAAVEPPPPAEVIEPAAPVQAQEPPPPPMVETPAISPWVFRMTTEAPKASDAAPEVISSVVKPEAPPIVSSLPTPVEEADPTPDAEAPPAAAAFDPVIDIWRRPAPVDVPESQTEPVRTRIQAVEVPAVDEALTEEITPPPQVEQPKAAAPPQVEQPKAAPPPVEQPKAAPPPVEQPKAAPPQVEQPKAAPPRIEARPVETSLPALDVAALQKATGESRPAARPITGEILSEAKLDIPAGLHEAAVLSQLIENQTPYSGVVVAIGLNDYDTLRDRLASGTDSVAALNKMVLSMLRPQDFACRFQDDEYILIYPGERGSSAQRRLFQVSEKLWDFQLRSLGNLSVMFSWGGLEVTNETLAEAVASARERMYQTKRNRKPSGLEFAVGRKKVVNG